MGPGSGRFPVRGSYLVRGLGRSMQLQLWLFKLLENPTKKKNFKWDFQKDLLIHVDSTSGTLWNHSGYLSSMYISQKDALKGPSLQLTCSKLAVAKFSTKLILNLCKLMVEYWDHWTNTLKYDMFGWLDRFFSLWSLALKKKQLVDYSPTCYPRTVCSSLFQIRWLHGSTYHAFKGICLQQWRSHFEAAESITTLNHCMICPICKYL